MSHDVTKAFFVHMTYTPFVTSCHRKSQEIQRQTGHYTPPDATVSFPLTILPIKMIR